MEETIWSGTKQYLLFDSNAYQQLCKSLAMIFGWSICIHSWRAIYRWRAVLFKSSSTIWPIPSPPNWHDMQSWIVKHYLLNLRWWMRSILVCPQEWSHDAWVSLLCICKVMQRSNILAIPMLRLQTVSGSSYCKNHPIWHHFRQAVAEPPEIIEPGCSDLHC